MASRKLEVVFVGDTKSLDKAINKAGKGTEGFGGKLKKFGKVAGGAGLVLGGALVGGAVKSLEAFAESEKVQAQTNATLKSTGGIAKVTSKHVGDLASSISKKSGLDDEAIQSGENLILTFTGIRNEAGKGNKIFDRTTQVVTDMSVALGQDMKSSAIQVGKALNDPVKGVSALQRVGVSFTSKQKEQIKTLEDTGHHLDAQKLILRELNKEFGGSAEAAGNTFAGKMNKAKVAVGNLAETVGSKLAPLVASGAEALANFLNGDGLANFTAKAQTFGAKVAEYIGVGVRAAQDFWTVAGPIVGAVVDLWLKVTQKQLAAVVQVVQGAFSVVKGTVELISGILTGDFGKAWQGVKDIFSGAVNGIVGAVRGATAPIRVAAGAVMGAVLHGIENLGGNLFAAAESRAAAIVSGIRSVIDNVTQAGRAIIAGVASGIATAASNLYQAAADRAGAVVSGARSVIESVTQAGRAMISGVASGVANAAANLFDAGKARAEAVVSGVKSLADDALGAGKHLVGSIAAGIRAAVAWVSDAVEKVLAPIRKLINTVSSAPGFLKKKLGLAQGGVAKFAQGGFAGGGFVMARVGELGPENVLLPVGSRVSHASDSAKPGSGGGDGPLIGTVVVQGTTDPRVIARDLAWTLQAR